MNISTILKRNLITHNISQKEAAQYLHMSPSSLSKKLSGKRALFLDEFAALCKLMKISADELLEKTDA